MGIKIKGFLLSMISRTNPDSYMENINSTVLVVEVHPAILGIMINYGAIYLIEDSM